MPLLDTDCELWLEVDIPLELTLLDSLDELTLVAELEVPKDEKLNGLELDGLLTLLDELDLPLELGLLELEDIP